VWSDVSVQPSTPSRRGALCENLPKFGRLHSIRRGTHCGDRGAPKGRVKQLRMHGNRAHEGLAHRDPTRPRTGLRPLVPCSTEKYREIRRFGAWA